MPEELPGDIQQFVSDTFPAGDVDDVRAHLGDLAETLRDDYGVRRTATLRILRCVCHLADGSHSELIRLVEAARTDWRDVIWWAEYAGGDQQIRDFSEPFD